MADNLDISPVNFLELMLRCKYRWFISHFRCYI